ncbi:MAG: autoinducer-2 kinase [Eubacteriales bacterium]|nr:autoinducer-2 kinase [Eubacteriales bacterium]
MEKKYLLAVDAGTGSIRAVLFDFFGNQIHCVQHEWEHAEDPAYPGSMNFDWVYNWELASKCIQNVISEAKIFPEEIAAISTTCMREGIVLYDKSGKEIWACANVDARSADEVVELLESYPGQEKELYHISGETYALSALPRLLWVKNKMPDVYQSISSIGMFNDWLIYKMTGILSVEPSNGSTSGLFSLKDRTWDNSLAERCGLRTDIFPPTQECGTLAGYVNNQCHDETGLAIGTPVIVGGGDCQMGCIGVGVVKPNQAAIFGGSFWQYEYNSASPKTDELCRVRVNCHAVPNVWQYEALAFKPGLVVRWFRDAFCQAEKELAKLKNMDTYDILNEYAMEVPVGSNGMMCMFSDVMDFIHWKHAAPTFTNFDLDPQRFSKYTFYRAILENTAFITKGHLDLVYESIQHLPQEIIFAGGASKSPLWCQILADVLGIPVKVPVVKEATALGAAIMAGHGIGLYPNLGEAVEKLVKWDAVYQPNMQNHSIYSELYSKWREAYKAQLNLCNQNLLRSMWSAPGL